MPKKKSNSSANNNNISEKRLNEFITKYNMIKDTFKLILENLKLKNDALKKIQNINQITSNEENDLENLGIFNLNIKDQKNYIESIIDNTQSILNAFDKDQNLLDKYKIQSEFNKLESKFTTNIENIISFLYLEKKIYKIHSLDYVISKKIDSCLIVEIDKDKLNNKDYIDSIKKNIQKEMEDDIEIMIQKDNGEFKNPISVLNILIKSLIDINNSILDSLKINLNFKKEKDILKREKAVLKDENNILENKNKNLEDQNKNLEDQNKNLEDGNSYLEKEFKNFKKKFKELKDEFEHTKGFNNGLKELCEFLLKKLNQKYLKELSHIISTENKDNISFKDKLNSEIINIVNKIENKKNLLQTINDLLFFNISNISFFLDYIKDQNLILTNEIINKIKSLLKLELLNNKIKDEIYNEMNNYIIRKKKKFFKKNKSKTDILYLENVILIFQCNFLYTLIDKINNQENYQNNLIENNNKIYDDLLNLLYSIIPDENSRNELKKQGFHEEFIYYIAKIFFEDSLAFCLIHSEEKIDSMDEQDKQNNLSLLNFCFVKEEYIKFFVHSFKFFCKEKRIKNLPGNDIGIKKIESPNNELKK